MVECSNFPLLVLVLLPLIVTYLFSASIVPLLTLIPKLLTRSVYHEKYWNSMCVKGILSYSDRWFFWEDQLVAWYFHILFLIILLSIIFILNFLLLCIFVLNQKNATFDLLVDSQFIVIWISTCLWNSLTIWPSLFTSKHCWVSLFHIYIFEQYAALIYNEVLYTASEYIDFYGCCL